MRSYLDIIIDLKDKKEVDKEELRVALLMANDLLIFAEKGLDTALETDRPGIRTLLRENKELRFKARKAPINQWFEPGQKQVFDEVK